MRSDNALCLPIVIDKKNERYEFLIPISEIPTNNLVLEADLCIVGSGPAGLTLASEFTNTNHKVALLEAGGFDYEVETQDIYEGKVVVGIIQSPPHACECLAGREVIGSVSAERFPLGT